MAHSYVAAGESRRKISTLIANWKQMTAWLRHSRRVPSENFDFDRSLETNDRMAASQQASPVGKFRL